MATKKYKTTLVLEVVVDPATYRATQEEIENFFTRNAKAIIGSAPKGAECNYEVKSEDLPENN